MTKTNTENVVNYHQESLKYEFETNYRKRLISEMINITLNRNSINKKADIHLFNSAYFPVLIAFNFQN